ncbi:restriction endonuclease subunit S [Anaerococcus sp. AGMB00486]|uniref:Restriction endonuclease subunit S n=1 Tax=Anaerococcus faecalis TaxID=2742993 RepID=A0ABX2N9S3_9FIRM|nr:restriction endonuclease subunit S [Anaerococcus faecalis]NVF11462.1 restriction endonuclease subunit S [Anaerococcus faecalis]
MKQNRLSLNDVEWGEFKIKDIFEVYLSKGDNKADLLDCGNIPLISSGFNSNGITKFINRGDGISEIIPKNTITVDMFGKAFYQDFDYYAVSHGRINILSPLYNLNKNHLLFCINSIDNATKNIFSYNRMCSSSRLSKLKILLPVCNKGNPNWQFMEDYIKQEQKDIAQKVIDYYEQKMLETSFDLVGLEDVEWKEFNFNDVFRKIQRGKRLKKDDHIDGNTPYISSTSLNNGLDGFIGNYENLRKFNNNITLANSGSVGSCFYHEYEYIASDHVTSLTLDKADKYIYLFMATIVKRLEEKYSFNREINDKRIKNEKFILPTDKNGEPNWAYMSKFMQKIEAENLQKVLEYIYIYKLAISYEKKLLPLHKKEWKEFWLEDIVDIESGKDIYERERIDGNIPYVTATAQNNGIGYFVNNINKTLEEKAISVNRNGSVGYAFYHDYKALYGNDTRKLIPKYKNKYSSLFLTTVITKQKEKYGYGYKMGTGRLKRQKILLPINELGNIDFAYMKKYMQIGEIKEEYKILDYYYKLLN